MAIAKVQRHREAVAYVKARWERALSRTRDSDAKALAIANMEEWHARNMRALDRQLWALQAECDRGALTRRDGQATKVAEPLPARPRVTRRAPGARQPAPRVRRYPTYPRHADPGDPFDTSAPG